MTQGSDVHGPSAERAPKRRSWGDRLRLAAAFLLGVITVLFAVLNLDLVAVNWIVGVWRTPLIVVIVVCVLIGAVIGFIVSRRHS
jgi:uncharacterized integral membrane protein